MQRAKLKEGLHDDKNNPNEVQEKLSEVQHNFIDFRFITLGLKLEQYRKKEEVKVIFDDFQLS